MDEFFKTLRDIQKKERNNVALSRVGTDFYQRIHVYLDELRTSVNKDPFSKHYQLLVDSQRIATEICERREHKITNSALLNIQRSYHLFKGSPKFDLQDTTPLNLTTEEEKLYFKVIDMLKEHRIGLGPSLTFEKDPNDSKTSFENDSNLSKTSNDVKLNKDLEINNDISNEKPKTESKVVYKPEFPSKTSKEDSEIKKEFSLIKETLSKAKIIENEKYEDINKQILKSRQLAEENLSIDDLENNNQFLDQIPTKDDTKLNKPIQNQKKESDLTEKKAKLNYNIFLFFKEVPEIVGMDEKAYGPFSPQDVASLPESNTDLLIKNKKGRLIKIR